MQTFTLNRVLHKHGPKILVSIRIPERLVKTQIAGPYSKFPIQEVWSGARERICAASGVPGDAPVLVQRPHWILYTQRSKNKTGNTELKTTCEKSLILKIY